MAISTNKLLLSDLLKHNVCCEKGINHGPIVSAWMHPPVHRILGCVSRPSNLKLERHVWRLDQIKGITQKDIYVKGDCSISDNQTLDRFPTLINANVFNRNSQKLGLIADFFFEFKTGKIEYYLVSRSNPLIPGTSRWCLSLSQILDKQPGSVSCNIDTFEDLPIQRASIKEEFLSKSRKWKTQLEDFTYQSSDRLEGWIDDQINQQEEDIFDESLPSQTNINTHDEWIDNLDIDTFEEFNTMNKRQRKKSFNNDRDLDPWI